MFRLLFKLFLCSDAIERFDRDRTYEEGAGVCTQLYNTDYGILESVIIMRYNEDTHNIYVCII